MFPTADVGSQKHMCVLVARLAPARVPIDVAALANSGLRHTKIAADLIC